jgi:hypothetical protein
MLTIDMHDIVAIVAFFISLMTTIVVALTKAKDKATADAHAAEVAKIAKLESRADDYERRIQGNELARTRLEAEQDGLTTAVEKLERAVEERMTRVEERLTDILLELQRGNSKKGQG